MAKNKAKGKAKSSAKADKQSSGEKSGKQKAVAVILALVFLLAVAFCGAGIGLRDKSIGKWYSTSTWYHNWGKNEKPGETGTPASGAVISEGESNGIMLLSEQIPVEAYSDYGITRASSSATYFWLTVEYTPANTTYQETDFEINFKNSESTWASGKNINDYASLLHEEGSTQARLDIKKAFSEPIIVTARSQRSPEIFGTATANWLCESVDHNFTSSMRNFYEDIEFKINKFIHGTIEPNGASCIEFCFKVEGFADFMKSKGYYYVNNDQKGVSDDYSITLDLEECLSGTIVTNIEIIIKELIGECYSDDPIGTWNAASEFFLNGYTPEYLTGSSIVYVEIFLHRYYEYNDESTGTGFSIEADKRCVTDYEISLNDWSCFEVRASNITINPGDVVGW